MKILTYQDEISLDGQDGLRLEGHTKLTVTDPKTGIVKIIAGKNSIITIGRQLTRDIGLMVCALGTGATVPALTDTRLVTEITRKHITSRTRSGNELTFSTFFAAAESAHHIHEVGIFGHASATLTANSGVLFSRWLVTFDNRGGLFDLTFDLCLKVK